VKIEEQEIISVHNILTERVFVIHLSSNAGISVWPILWVVANCRFMSDVCIVKYNNSKILSYNDPRHKDVWVKVNDDSRRLNGVICLLREVAALLHGGRTHTHVPNLVNPWT